MSAPGSLCIILVLITVSSTFASSIGGCPESAAASRHDQPKIPNNDDIIPEAPLLLPPANTATAPQIPNPDTDSILPGAPLVPSANDNNIPPEEAPLLPPPAHPAAAPQPEQNVTDGVEPLMQPSASTYHDENRNGNGSGSGGGEQLGADNQYKNTNTNTGFAGATRAAGGGVAAQPLVDNTPFDSGSTTGYPFIAFSSFIALMILPIFI